MKATDLLGRRSQSPVQVEQLRLVILDRDLEQRDSDYSCHLLFVSFPLERFLPILPVLESR